jgi:hypothetical protein
MPQGISRRTEPARQERAPGHPEPDALRHGWHRQQQKHRRCPIGIGCWRERPAMGETKALARHCLAPSTNAPRAARGRTGRAGRPEAEAEAEANTVAPWMASTTAETRRCHIAIGCETERPAWGASIALALSRAERSSAASFPKPVSRTRGWSLTGGEWQRSCAPLYKSHALLFRRHDTGSTACLTTFTLRHKVIDIWLTTRPTNRSSRACWTPW